MEGYRDLQADVAEQQVTVTYNRKETDPKALVKAINEHTSFKASVLGGA